MLVQDALRQLCLSYVMEESGQHNIAAFRYGGMHPFRNDTCQYGDAQGMLVDIAGKMIELEEVVDDAAVSGKRDKGGRDDALGIFHALRFSLADLREDFLRILHNAAVFLYESIATIEYGRCCLVIAAELVVILDVDDRDIQEIQARDMSLGEHGVFRYHDYHVLVDQGSCQYHAGF